MPITTKAREITRRLTRGRALADNALTCSMIWGYRSRIAIALIRCKIQVLVLKSCFTEVWADPVCGQWPFGALFSLTEQQFCSTMIGRTQSLFTGDKYV